EHPEAQRERTRVRVEKRFLFNGIALHAADVAPWHAEASAIVEAHLADANRTVRQRALVAAGITTQSTIRQNVVQFAIARFSLEDVRQGRHRTDSLYVGSGSPERVRVRGL